MTVSLDGDFVQGRQHFRAQVGAHHAVRSIVAEQPDGHLDLVEVTFSADGAAVSTALVRAVPLPRLLNAVAAQVQATSFWSVALEGVDGPALTPDERKRPIEGSRRPRGVRAA